MEPEKRLQRDFELHVSFPSDQLEVWHGFDRGKSEGWGTLEALEPMEASDGPGFSELHEVPGELAFLATKHFQGQQEALRETGDVLELINGCSAVRIEFEEVLYVLDGDGGKREIRKPEEFEADAWDIPGLVALDHTPPFEVHYVLKSRDGGPLSLTSRELKEFVRAADGVPFHQAALFGPQPRFVLTTFFFSYEPMITQVLASDRVLRSALEANHPEICVKTVVERINMCMKPGS